MSLRTSRNPLQLTGLRHTCPMFMPDGKIPVLSL